MASSYWDSTQRRFWQFSKEQLATMRQNLEDENQDLQMFPLPQWRHLSIFFNQQINRLGKRLCVRQQAMATAQVYMKRFYVKVEVRRTNPYLVIATALYLACKMEECPQHIRLVIGEAKQLWQDVHCLEIPKLGECEFFMISEMNSQLIIHQPYRTLTTLQSDLFLSQEEVALSWSVINDHYMTDLPLLYPPHVIAMTAILLGLVFQPGMRGAGANAGGAAAAPMGLAAASAALVQAQQQARAAMQSQGGAPGSMLPTPGGMTTPTSSQPSSSQQQQQQQSQTQSQCQQSQSDNAAAREKFQESRNKVQRFLILLSESNVEIEAMVDCTQELIAFYECHEQYNDKLTREQIHRYIKARGLER